MLVLGHRHHPHAVLVPAVRDDVHRRTAVAEGPRPRAGDGWGDRRLARLETLRRCVNEEVSMDEHRRDFLKQITTLAAAGMPIVTVAEPLLARAGEAQRRSGMKTPYDPAAMFELKVSEVEFLRTPAGRQLMARIYQPQGTGPFPTVLDLHGGAWRRKDRLAEEPMDRAIAASGVLVVAIDLRLSEEAPYAASVQDANYGVRWLKIRAAEWNGDPSKIGVYGSSSGGHVAQLLAMRPRDPRYHALALASASYLDATLAYVATPPPISDTYARLHQARRVEREGMIENNRIYFNPWDTIHQANPHK